MRSKLDIRFATAWSRVNPIEASRGLSATGRCVSQDRVQAYDWFNEALRNDPNNEYVERSRATLWAQMTSEERQRASKEQQ